VLPSQQTIYEGAGPSIGQVKGFEQGDSNACPDPWSPFTRMLSFQLASWFIEGKVPKSRINAYFSSDLGDAILAGYISMHTLENHLPALDPRSAYLK